MLDRVFELFTQAETSLDRAQGGMGIGLTLVRSLVELHGGTVRAESEGLGRGSTFTVLLPSGAPADAAAPEEGALSAPSASRRVVVVEDNPDLREQMVALLEDFGHRVESASDGLSGVESITRARPEIALVDIGLPGLDGYEVARRVRALLGPEIGLVALTGYGQPEDRQRALEAGFDAHLTKPVTGARLADLIQARARS
jgi:CheY-like chemotaxis protein